MELASILLICSAAVFYLAATALYAYQLKTRADSYLSAQGWLSGLGLLCQTMLLGVLAMHFSGTQLVGANILMLASWSVMVAYFIFEKVSRRRSYGVFIVPVVLICMVLSWELGAGIAPAGGNLVYEQWPLLVVHVVAYFVAASFFLLGGASAIMLVYEEKQIKSKKLNVLESRLPSLSFLKKAMRRSIVIGLPIFLLGILLGIVRATGLNIENWWISPRIIMSFIVLAVCLVILVQAYLAKTSTNTIARMHIANSVCVIVLTVFSSVLPMLGN